MDDIEQAVGSYIVYATEPALHDLKNALVPKHITENEFSILILSIDAFADRHKDKGNANIIKNITRCINEYISIEQENRIPENLDLVCKFYVFL